MNLEGMFIAYEALGTFEARSDVGAQVRHYSRARGELAVQEGTR